MKKVLFKTIVSLLVVLSCVLIVPFHIFADEVPVSIFNTNNVLGFNVTYDTTITSGGDVLYNNDIEVIFDDYYIGGPVSYTIRYYSDYTNSYQTSSGKFGINGTSVHITVTTRNYPTASNKISFTSFTYTNSIYRQIDYLQMFPIESFPAINYMVGTGFYLEQIANLGSYKFPVYDAPTGSVLNENYSNINNPNAYELVYIFGVDKSVYDQTSFDNKFEFVSSNDSNLTYSYEEYLYRVNLGSAFSIFKVKCHGSLTNSRIKLQTKDDLKVMPIFVGYTSQENFSMDFALQFNLNNKILNFIDNLNNNYNFPFESYSYVLETSQYLTIDSSYQIFNYIYPLFIVNGNDLIVNNFRCPSNDIVDLVFLHISTTPNTTYVYNNFSLVSDEYLMNNQLANNKYLIIKHLQLKNITNDAKMLNVRTYNEGYFIPIYCNLITRNHISDSFAYTFDLKQTNSSSENLESQSNQFESDAQQMYSYENTFNTDMNNNLNNINTNFNIGNTLGSKFMYSATWVKTQFDNLTNNTPFGTVLSFSLLLGIAMLLIGKAL